MRSNDLVKLMAGISLLVPWRGKVVAHYRKHCSHNQSDVLEDGENALLLDPPWPMQLTNAICRIVTSENLRRELGQAARKTIEERFESNLVFEQYRQAILAATTVSAPGHS